MYNIERWPNIFFKKILQYEHRKIFQVCLTIFHHYVIFYHDDIFHHYAQLRENLFMCSYEMSVKIFRPWKEKTSTKFTLTRRVSWGRDLLVGPDRCKGSNPLNYSIITGPQSDYQECLWSYWLKVTCILVVVQQPCVRLTLSGTRGHKVSFSKQKN